MAEAREERVDDLPRLRFQLRRGGLPAGKGGGRGGVDRLRGAAEGGAGEGLRHAAAAQPLQAALGAEGRVRQPLREEGDVQLELGVEQLLCAQAAKERGGAKKVAEGGGAAVGQGDPLVAQLLVVPLQLEQLCEPSLLVEGAPPWKDHAGIVVGARHALDLEPRVQDRARRRGGDAGEEARRGAAAGREQLRGEASVGGERLELRLEPAPPLRAEGAAAARAERVAL